jgi:hypothetical protein
MVLGVDQEYIMDWPEGLTIAELGIWSFENSFDDAFSNFRFPISHFSGMDCEAKRFRANRDHVRSSSKN